MQANFEYLWRQLVAEIPALPPQAAQRYISNSWHSIQSLREWSWRERDGIVLFPSNLTTGTISLTKNSLTATLSAAALAAWNADTQLPLIASRQLRLPGVPNRVFSIDSFDSGTGEITLDSLYTGTTNATSSYQLYSAYVTPLQRNGGVETFFGRFLSLRSLTVARFLDDSKDRRTQEDLNRLDRGRTNYGFPLYYSFVKFKDSGTYPQLIRTELYEFWPHCNQEVAFESRYLKKPVSFEDDPDQILPATVNPKLVIYGALLEAYRWADQQRSTEKSLAGTNWGLKAAKLASKFPSDGETFYSLFRDHEREDDNFRNNTLIRERSSQNSLFQVPITTIVNSR